MELASPTSSSAASYISSPMGSETGTPSSSMGVQDYRRLFIKEGLKMKVQQKIGSKKEVSAENVMESSAVILTPYGNLLDNLLVTLSTVTYQTICCRYLKLWCILPHPWIRSHPLYQRTSNRQKIAQSLRLCYMVIK